VEGDRRKGRWRGAASGCIVTFWKPAFEKQARRSCVIFQTGASVGEKIAGGGKMEEKGGPTSARSGRKRTQVGTTNRVSTLLSPDGAATATTPAPLLPQGSKDRRASDTGRGRSASGALRPHHASSAEGSTRSSGALLASSRGPISVSAFLLLVAAVRTTPTPPKWSK